MASAAASPSSSSLWRALIFRYKRSSFNIPFLRNSQVYQDQKKDVFLLQQSSVYHGEENQQEEENLHHLWKSSSSSSSSSSSIFESRDRLIPATSESEDGFLEHRFGSKLGFSGSSLALESSLHDFLNKNGVGVFKLGFPNQEIFPLSDNKLDRFGSNLGFRASSLNFETSVHDFLNTIHVGSSKLERFVHMPGVLGSDDISMEADSVKRKRKKKMNKHKHRKLRRLARKSKK